MSKTEGAMGLSGAVEAADVPHSQEFSKTANSSSWCSRILQFGYEPKDRLWCNMCAIVAIVAIVCNSKCEERSSSDFRVQLRFL